LTINKWQHDVRGVTWEGALSQQENVFSHNRMRVLSEYSQQRDVRGRVLSLTIGCSLSLSYPSTLLRVSL